MNRLNKNKTQIMVIGAILLLFFAILILQTTNKAEDNIDYDFAILQESANKVEASLLIANHNFNLRKDRKSELETELQDIYAQKKEIMGFQKTQ